MTIENEKFIIINSNDKKGFKIKIDLVKKKENNNTTQQTPPVQKNINNIYGYGEHYYD